MLVKRLLKKLYHQLQALYYGRGYRRFGTGSVIHKPMRVIGKKYISIGSQCYFGDGLRMEAIDEWGGEMYTPEIEFSENVLMGQNCHITSAHRIKIGRGVSILPDVLITDIEHERKKDIPLSQTGLLVGSVEIGDYVVIGMGARIIGNRHIKIGNNAVIGANAVIKHDIPDDAVAVGIPGKVIKYSK